MSEDPERDWDRIAPHALHDTNTYAAWLTDARSAAFAQVTDADELRRQGRYRVVTPEECVEIASRVELLYLHPMMGGLAPDVGWESLELFAAKVMPELGGAGDAAALPT